MENQLPQSKDHESTNYSFENFVQGDCNIEARRIGLHITTQLWRDVNPLIVQSDVGLGKTHLVHAIYNQLRHQWFGDNHLFIGAENFHIQISDALRKNKMTNIVDHFLKFKAIIIDDLHFLEKKYSTQNVLLEIHNNIAFRRMRMIYASRYLPEELSDFDPDLITRLMQGVTVSLLKPNFETRLEILKKMVCDGHFKIPENVLAEIAQYELHNVRDLGWVLLLIWKETHASNKDVDIAGARSVISSYLKGKK
ncbi:MAG: DnaA/Hda family protein [Bacteroidota bacterium]